ncbi:hypothetical protein R0J89_15420, partial [Psychrobacter sp. SIMBA_152]
ALTEVTGNNNNVYVSQNGQGFLVNNEAINIITGYDNYVEVEQGSGGHWFYNMDMQGNANEITAFQSGEWSEAEVSMLTGDDNLIYLSQAGFWNTFKVTSLQGNDNEID